MMRCNRYSILGIHMMVSKIDLLSSTRTKLPSYQAAMARALHDDLARAVLLCSCFPGKIRFAGKEPSCSESLQSISGPKMKMLMLQMLPSAYDARKGLAQI